MAYHPTHELSPTRHDARIWELIIEERAKEDPTYELPEDIGMVATLLALTTEFGEDESGETVILPKPWLREVMNIKNKEQ